MTQDDWCPYKEGEVGHEDRCILRKDDVETQREDGHVIGVVHLEAKGARDCW